jgi:hypothetical protein
MGFTIVVITSTAGVALSLDSQYQRRILHVVTLAPNHQAGIGLHPGPSDARDGDLDCDKAAAPAG